MGGNSRQRKSFFSIFKRGNSNNSNSSSAAKKTNDVVYSSKNYNYNYHWEDQGGRPRRVFPSDEDRGYWVAEPGIDRKASAFIAKFHEARRSEAQTMQQQPPIVN